jgi:hypothetical protein
MEMKQQPVIYFVSRKQGEEDAFVLHKVHYRNSPIEVHRIG